MGLKTMRVVLLGTVYVDPVTTVCQMSNRFPFCKPRKTRLPRMRFGDRAGLVFDVTEALLKTTCEG